MGTTSNSGVIARSGSGPIVYPGSLVSDWITILDDVGDGVTAQAATVLARPCTYSDTNSHPIRVPDGAVGFLVRCKYANDISAVTASAVVRFYGMSGADPSAAGVFADDGTVDFIRVDNSSQAASGLTITPVATGNTRLRNTTYGFGDVLPTSGRYDIRCGKWLLALTETKAQVTAGALASQVVAVQIRFTN